MEKDRAPGEISARCSAGSCVHRQCADDRGDWGNDEGPGPSAMDRRPIGSHPGYDFRA